ncbi:alpha-amylase family protein [Olivibacter sp. XZL3]|uniref:alpha-amylase family protein n=1 Tax=Olivibacter sp. XZL3 TaxID=1735116 RepID=UPI001416F725|nr:alpha-amylase family protein [Olivibacter sp. XZL3]
MLDFENSTNEHLTDHKLIIYQLFVRLFGNTTEMCKHNGSLEENGCGKFNDISVKALNGIKKLGVSHIWYMGVIEHATTTDYSAFDLPADDPNIVKGRAGSPYAVRNYYNVDPDLAVSVDQRFEEFKALIERTHAQGLKVVLDFVPNHVSRNYSGKEAPSGIVAIGAEDNTSKSFSPTNDFYYVTGEAFRSPLLKSDGNDRQEGPVFEEIPAKATGNDVFVANPGLHDWFDTVKLNYGVDYLGGRKLYDDPIPPLWYKMYDVLQYWAANGVDAFRCDMVEMVPLAFWGWVIPKLKEHYPELIFIAEIYNPTVYRAYIEEGNFDYLYDKVGLYDSLRRLIEDHHDAHVDDITKVWKHQCNGFSKHMLRFLENHDEQRIASRFFAGNPWFAKAAMVIATTFSSGPVMLYFGQEIDEPAAGATGYSNDDGRTTIYDYTAVPNHQRWMNGGAFDGAGLDENEKALRKFYNRLLWIARDQEAVLQGAFFELLQGNSWSEGFNGKTYAFLRYTQRERLLIVANFERRNKQVRVFLPDEVLNYFGLDKHEGLELRDLLSEKNIYTSRLGDGIAMQVVSTDAFILKF